MYKWITAIVIGLSVIASVSVMKFGLKPKPIPIIKASNFEDPQQLGLYIYRQLYQKLRTSPVFILGFNPNNAYEKKAIESLMTNVMQSDLEKSPIMLQVSSDESFSGSPSSKQDQVRSRFGEKMMAFSVINLSDVEEASEIMNCEKDHNYSVWIECIKKQKVRQMNHAKKVDLKKPIAIVENQSQRDIMIYIRE